MRQRIPGYIFIPLVVLIVLGVFFFMKQDLEIFKSVFVWLVVGLAVLLAMVVNSLNRTIESARFKKLDIEQKKAYLQLKKKGYVSNLLNSAGKKQSDKEEEEILIDHGFDGIMELDNSLPQWWVSMFFLGVLACAVYLLSFAFTDFAKPQAELSEADKIYNSMVDDFYKNAPVVTPDNAEPWSLRSFPRRHPYTLVQKYFP